ncbi:hypothetical protein DWX75_09720 [Mitsuokella sp. AF21-1AC]|nr:hypothetical protein DWX75_09720 [Mitsuokella sp. AF21-1AC]
MACEGNQFAESIKHRTPRTGAKQSFPLRGKWPAGSIGELLAVAFLLDERRNARALRDAFRLQRTAKCDPICCVQQRGFAACRGVLTSGVKRLWCGAPSLRAIAARLQAEYIPPLGLLSFGRTTSAAIRAAFPAHGEGAELARRKRSMGGRARTILDCKFLQTS